MALIPSNNRIGIAAVAINGIAGVLAIIAVLLRIWARKINGSRLDASDWTCVVGLIIGLGCFASTVLSVIYGLGISIEKLEAEQFASFNKDSLAGIFLWTAASTLIRISMILLYIRLFPARKFVIFCWIFLIENVLCGVAVYLATVLICRPFAFNWNRTIPGGHCGNQQSLYVWSGVQNLLQDIVTTLMPMPLLWGLQLPLNKKIGLSLIFAMGTGICVLTLFRTIETERATALSNVTAEYASVGILFTLEPLLGTINCCLPLLRPVLQKLGFAKSRPKSTPNNPSFVQSIGSRRTRKLIHDPYPLDTVIVRNEESDTAGSHKDDNDSIRKLINDQSLAQKSVPVKS